MDTVKIDKKATHLIAHRGLSGIETENTCAAFVAAGNRSYYGIETDIHRTIDGQFVINHDGNLKRLAGEDISVECATMKTLSSIILFDKDGTKVREDLRPTNLESYISICKKYEKHCVLELKSKFTDNEIARIIEIIKSYGYLDNVTFISFDYDNLLKIKAILPNQSAQYLFFELNDEIIEQLSKAKIDVDAHYKCLTKENIEKCHKAGLVVNCWTVDNKEEAERLIMYGIDYVTTNILE